ncbi:MAG TPA: SDR family NAD(P)-dependent oxidoreductase [Bryobacteraceae bacterium]|nr:SDR family NAD(P)-dependent oxidoreductase [Bryobacteraceae bacterium]
MLIDFSGKTAVVTGGASGIGAAIGRALKDSGASVHILDLRGDPPVDVTDSGAVEAAFARTPVPDVVIVNAGTAVPAELTATTDEIWLRTISVNLTGAFNAVRAAARRMTPARRGAIVLTASTNSYDGEPLLTAYNASKAGLLGIVHTAAGELGPYGIRVNAVCPGLIRTPLTEAHFSNPALLKEYFRHIPLGRGGEPEEVATAALFLASDLASYITGATLFVDGGQMATKFGAWSESNAQFSGDRWTLVR